MKKILAEFSFDDGQLNSIARLARECNLAEQTAAILYGRGMDTPQKVSRFINAGKEYYISPFKMSGMQEAVELITRARDENWVVAVYGDYDADGICAATIMRAALKTYGIDPVVFVPERKNGYGLSCAAIDEIFDEYNPQLFITVDCGISNAGEVAYVQEQGAEVIVTDHHELPDKLPDCICVNPKFNDGYEYDNLCGAGVAFKVGIALNGKSFYSYADMAAIATVADSVPLVGENRDIVREGLKIMNKSPRKCYAGFLSRTGEPVTSQTISFVVAPRINAAGRMGDAYAALQLFSSEDDGEIYDLTTKLSAYNLERQKKCDELYASAKEQLNKKGAFGRVIMLMDENWNSGFVGIVAARLAEEYCRPALLFVKNGDTLKGSARSVESVNIFEALKACSQYIQEFGGHSQAAGVNVTEENFSALEEALNDYISQNCAVETFVPSVYVYDTPEDRISQRVAKELELLEPYGVGNKRPMFYMEAESCAVRPLKPMSAHINIKYGNAEMTCFSGAKYTRILRSGAPKKLVFEYNVSTFRGKEYIKGLVRDVIYSPEGLQSAAEEAQENNLINASYPAVNCKIKYVSAEEAKRAVEDGVYGTVFLANNYSTVKKFNADKRYGCEAFNISSKIFTGAVLVSPLRDVDLSAYGRVIWLDNPQKITLPALEGREVEVCKDIDGLAGLKKVAADRQALVSIFRWIGANSAALPGINAEEAASNANPPFAKLNLLFALKVFEELSILSFESGSLKINRGVKNDLSNSRLFTLLKN